MLWLLDNFQEDVIGADNIYLMRKPLGEVDGLIERMQRDGLEVTIK